MRIRSTPALVALALVAGLVPAMAQHTVPVDCASSAPEPQDAPTVGVADPAGDIRVIAVQVRQSLPAAASVGAFMQHLECLFATYVSPALPGDADEDGRQDLPTIVVLNEDLGLATIAAGARGEAARVFAAHGPKDPANIPGALGSFALVGGAFAPAIADVLAREPETSAQRAILAAATDTFVRAFMDTMSVLARRHGVYVVASNNQAEFRRSSDPREIAAYMDPSELAHPWYRGNDHVFVPVDDDRIPESVGVGRAGIDVTNQAWMWAPVDGVTEYAHATFDAINGAPLLPDDPRANIIHRTTKTPLTSLELEILDLSDQQDLTPTNTGPYCLLPQDDASCRARFGYGISLPAFMWGDTELHEPFTGDPCASNTSWMRCLDARGVTVFLQPEANPGMWADYIDQSWSPAAYQSLSWLDSAWRAVADRSVEHIRYAITPHLVGNLVDLTFDGQSVIFERCLPRASGDSCDGNVADTFVGASVFEACAPPARVDRCDDPLLEPYAGAHRETIVQAPWVLDDCPLCLGPISDRERLAARARAMQAGSMSPYENRYVETAIWADLDLD